MTNDAETRPGRLSGKSAVITGAAKGIGRATADLFAAEGARLVITDIDEPALKAAADDLRAEGAEVVEVSGSVAEATDAEAMISAAITTSTRSTSWSPMPRSSRLGPSSTQGPRTGTRDGR